MLIDWFTVLAQTVNFLILVWLLKRFLYKPVLAAVDAREAKIAATLKDAATKKAEAASERDSFQSKSTAIEAQRAQMLRKATDEASAERQRLLVAARADADALRTKLTDDVKNERIELNREIVARTREEVLAVVRKTLSDLADTSLEDRIVEVFIHRLHDLHGDPNTPLANDAPAAAAPVCVRSAFELGAAARSSIEAAIGEWLRANNKPTFETAPGLVSGIELIVGGRKLAWSITDYLDSLSERVASLLEPKAKAVAAAANQVKDAA
jgi:F-type H+-transporting ATPase subunit b